ncbi:MAG TPA: hypothetical protein VJ183_20140 [Chloroflexia bacterium]|nr:hypothetical protein [Chloroflexia bacterium]
MQREALPQGGPVVEAGEVPQALRGPIMAHLLRAFRSITGWQYGSPPNLMTI